MSYDSESAAEVFRTGSLQHAICLAVCAVLVALFARGARKAVLQRDLSVPRRLRRFVGWGCLAVWLLNTLLWTLASPFDWGVSLPLQFCNFANLIGAAAVLGKGRLSKSVLYFWSLVLCIWAFLTPVVGGGYATIWFWVFWAYHLFIPLALVQLLVLQGFRPGLADLRNAWFFTLGYMIILMAADYRFGWSYGFVGPSDPGAPTLIDVLGPYPLRLLWMVLIGSLLFVLVWLPWRKRT